MSRRWVILAVAAQLLVLLWMAGEREWVFRTGQVVYLRTAPIDPRDLFRGDFVRLQYEINSVRRADVDEAIASRGTERRRHEVVYTRLRPSGEGRYEAAGTSTTRPADGPFLRGRTEDSWRMGWRGGGHFFVKYGIEQLFVEQGRGKAIEERRGTRDGLQVPMEVEVAVASSGTAVIRGYRWSRLGMKLEMLRRPARRVRNAPPPEGPLSPKLRVTLANVSDAPLTVADAGEHCAFHLVPVAWAPQLYPPASPACSAGQMAPEMITLAPGQIYSAELDLSEPRWHVLAAGKAVEIGALQGLAQFRIEYRTPEAAPAAAGERSAWRGRMASQAFTANGVVD
ncbi:MAG: GDYXXLXY domain-containing protein [Betaproteobacteria bacterium]|nr:GDYXXLXY domain-containing protein [Betaproteobacteria bacterium]